VPGTAIALAALLALIIRVRILPTVGAVTAILGLFFGATGHHAPPVQPHLSGDGVQIA
jgi:hypothetical protein